MGRRRAEYQVQASEVKHGISSTGGRHVKGPRSFFGTGDKHDRPCKLGVQPKTPSLEVRGTERNGKQEEVGDSKGNSVCVIVA